MSRYRLTMDEFLQLYGDVPEYRYLYDTRESKRDRNGNTEEVQEEIRRLSKEGRVKRRLSFWKTGSTASIPKTEPVSNAERSEDEGEDTEVFMEDKDNPVSKLAKQFGRMMLRHFYFMNVVVEKTGGAYVVRYGSDQSPDQIQLNYCYTSSYATTTCDMTMAS